MKKIALLAILIALCLPSISQVDFRKETIYFLITSRFNDGDSTNNAPNEWCSYFPGNPNNANFSGQQDVTWRGDFRGLIQKLDYIKDLGFTAIWITPVVQNRGPLDYHGYHAWDFTKVDNRLTSPGAGFKDLIDAAHAKGMKVILDMVTNHSGRFGIKDASELKYNTDPTQPWGKDKNGNALADNPNWSYDGLTPNPLDDKIWSRSNIAKMPAPYNSNLANNNWPSTQSFVNTSDPAWFHHWGNGFVQGWDDTTNCYNGAIAGDCPDLNTGSKAVQDYFFNAYKQYIDMGIDGMRWDTWKHINKEDVFVLMDRFKAVNPNLFILGEVAQKRHELHQVQELNPHWYTWRGGVGTSASSGASVLDFYAEGTFHNIFQDGGGFSGVSAAARYDNLYSDPSQLVTWLDNHDFGPNNDWNQRYSGSDENLAACMNFMFTWRGIPSVYYGTEMRFKSGAWTDIHDAADINKSLDNTGRAYYGNVMNNAPNHVIYKHIKKLNAIRKAIPALQNGSWSWGGNGPGNGIGYTRRSGSSFVVVGLAKDGSASFNFTGVDNGTYRDAVTGKTVTVSNGSIGFTVTSGSAGIYVLNGPGMIGDNGAGFFEACTSGCTTSPVVKISPISNNYAAPITVTMSATGGTGPYSIYYTLNGTQPTIASSKYIASFTVSTRKIVRAIAVDANGRVSDLDGQQYTFESTELILNATPSAGNYFSAQSIALSTTGGKKPVKIYYTTNGNAPTISSTVYNTPISISTAKTIKALAVDSANTQTTLTAAYTFIIPPPVVIASPVSGNYPTPPITVLLTASSQKPPVKIYYTTNGTTPTISSTLYTSSFSLTGTATTTKVVKFIGVDSIGNTSTIDSVKYTFAQIPDIWIYFRKPATWAGAKIHYWNTFPAGSLTSSTWPGVDMTLHCNDWYKFKFSGITSTNIVFNDGAGKQTADLSASTTSYYDNAWLTTIPTMCNGVNTPPVVSITPASTTFADSIKVTLSVTDDKAGSVIYYTTNGSVASTTSTIYSAPFWVKSTTIVNVTAKDVDGAMAASPATATYTKSSVAGGITAYFENTALWTQPKIYCWSAVPTTYMCSAWPGVNMTPVVGCPNWWSFTFPNVTSTNLIINSGTGVQSADLTRTIGTYSYSWATKLWTNGGPACLKINTPPSVTITPGTSTFADSVKVILKATDDTTGSKVYYTTDGTTPTNKSKRYSKVLWIKSTTTIRAIAQDIDSAYSPLATATLTKAGIITVYFENTALWAKPRVECWSPAPSTYTGCIAFPGRLMTQVLNCGNWWKYSFLGVNLINLRFNNGSAQKTVDLIRSTTGTFSYSFLTKAWTSGAPTCFSIAAKTPGTFELLDEANKLISFITPNPVTTNTPTLHIETKTSGIGSIQIIDQRGAIIKTLKNVNFKSGENTIPINLAGKGSGYFIALVRMEEKYTPVKFIVSQ